MLQTREGISLGTAHLLKRLESLAFSSRRRTGIARVISPSCPDLVAKMYNRFSITVGVVSNSESTGQLLLVSQGNLGPGARPYGSDSGRTEDRY